jgi:uncharacterized protein (TIGR02452 family)
MDEYNLKKGQRRRNQDNKHKDVKKPAAFNSLKAIYEDTVKTFNNLGVKAPVSTLYKIGEIPEATPEEVFEEQVDVRNIDTFDMAQEYVASGLHPLVLNMASEYKAGGGVANGKTAQEECLFRRSNAFMTHPKKWYPLEKDEIIYSPEVYVIKDNNYDMMDRDDFFKVGMVAVAALRKPYLNKDHYYDKDKTIMIQKIESIFEIALANNHDSLVLGALGCGVFLNPPLEVAKIFKQMIEKYGKHFRRIGFAILVIKPKDEQNIKDFKSTLN